MHMRRDAARAIFDLMDHVYREFPRIGGRDTVWNIGNFSLRPGAANVVPQHAEMLIECRDLDEAVLERLEGSLHARARSYNASGSAQIETRADHCIAARADVAGYRRAVRKCRTSVAAKACGWRAAQVTTP